MLVRFLRTIPSYNDTLCLKKKKQTNTWNTPTMSNPLNRFVRTYFWNAPLFLVVWEFYWSTPIDSDFLYPWLNLINFDSHSRLNHSLLAYDADLYRSPFYCTTFGAGEKFVALERITITWLYRLNGPHVLTSTRLGAEISNWSCLSSMLPAYSIKSICWSMVISNIFIVGALYVFFHKPNQTKTKKNPPRTNYFQLLNRNFLSLNVSIGHTVLFSSLIHRTFFSSNASGREPCIQNVHKLLK